MFIQNTHIYESTGVYWKIWVNMPFQGHPNIKLGINLSAECDFSRSKMRNPRLSVYFHVWEKMCTKKYQI